MNTEYTALQVVAIIAASNVIKSVISRFASYGEISGSYSQTYDYIKVGECEFAFRRWLDGWCHVKVTNGNGTGEITNIVIINGSDFAVL